MLSQAESFDDSHAVTLSGAKPGAPVRELRPGDIIGGSYRLKSLIAKGGMGYVFCAEHLTLSQEYALKMLAPEMLNESTRKRFESEGRAIANLNHASIVRVYNMGLDADGSPFYVMDLLSGRTLNECIRSREDFSLKECLDILGRVADGLNYAHGKGIIHRDVKPSNIILLAGKDGRRPLKIVDFGLAKVPPKASFDTQSQTMVGEVFGSPFYMSPEQCAGKPVDVRSDIYSLGCTLYQMLTAAPPFRGNNHMETMLLQQTAPRPSVIKNSPMAGLPPSIDMMVAKMMAKRPAERYQTMEQVIHDIERIKQGKAIGRSLATGMVTSTDNPVVRAADAEAAGAVAGDARPATRGGMQPVKDVDDSGADPAPGAGRGKYLLLAGIALGATLLIAVGGGMWYFNFGHLPSAAGKHAAHSAAVEGASSSAGAGVAAGASSGTAADGVPSFEAATGKPKVSDDAKQGPTEDYQHALAAYDNFAPIKSTEIVRGNRHFRKFVFPIWSVGTVNAAPTWQKEAEGVVIAPGDMPLALEVGLTPRSKQVLNHPAIFEKIDPGEFTFLTIGGTDSDDMASAIQGEAPESERVLRMMNRAAGWTRLTGLVLNGVVLDRKKIDALNGFKLLRTLEFHTSPISNYSDLEDQPFLKRLDDVIFYEANEMDAAFPILAQCPKLRTLQLLKSTFSSVGLSNLASMASLKTLNIYLPVQDQYTPPELVNSTPGLKPVFHVDVSKFVKVLCRLKTVEKLAFHGARLNAEQIGMLAGCPNIKKLDLSAGMVPPAVQAICRSKYPNVVFNGEPID